MTNTKEPREFNPREDIRQNAVKIIEKWKHFWMDQYSVTKDQADHENYLHRALGVDANMKYHLAGLFADEYESLKRELEIVKAELKLATFIINESDEAYGLLLKYNTELKKLKELSK